MLQKGRENSKEKGDKKQHEVALNLLMHMKNEQKCVSSHSSREQNATKGSTPEVYENLVKKKYYSRMQSHSWPQFLATD